ncbi:MAG TPA: UvrD-helicase domain-containing protein [Ktedonobacterales bacterium]
MCAELDLELKGTPVDDVMLGGAHSRLQLWAWDQPGLGGIIWLREELEPEMRAFAIAHELGHYALHRGEGANLYPACDQNEINLFADPADLRTEDHRVEEYTPRARRELEANAFAAELLAPRAEVRRLFTSSEPLDAQSLAARFGISRDLAQRRLIDAVLANIRPADDSATSEPERAQSEASPAPPIELIERLDDWQRKAARAPGPALVVAGPGTGKTATLVGRVAHLTEERSIPPEKALALTFSNRAAGELRERLARSSLPGERIPVMTIHAFAASILREYASRVPHALDEAELKPDFRILDESDAFLLAEELLGEFPLHYYRSLGKPTARLRTLLSDFAQARDGLLSPAAYLALVDAMPLASEPSGPPEPQEEPRAETSDARVGRARRRQARSQQPKPPTGFYTAEQIAKARERALAYGVWDRALRRRGLVEYGGLIQRAVELLRADAAALAEVRSRYREVLVDEFQDTNHAAAELLMLVAGESGAGLWVVGDRNQSIYRFRGASPSNLPRLAERHPTLRVLTLRRCYRSVPGIVRLGSAMAARMATLAQGAADSEAAQPAATGSATTDALREAMRPLELEPVRDDGAHPAIRREETFTSAIHERVGLAMTIQQHHLLGYAYADQAVLCRTHKQARQIAAVLTSEGVPVSQLGNFFDRPEVKDALTLVMLAAGPDARGVLRAAPLLTGLGRPAPADGELAAAARALSAKRQHLPYALRGAFDLGESSTLSATTREALASLGAIATQLRHGRTIGLELAEFLLRPGGYAWQLARIADGLNTPRAGDLLRGGQAGSEVALATVTESPARAHEALVALGELVRLAWRFDTRWAREPEFRARLSRAVTSRRTVEQTEPEAPDVMEPALSADITSDHDPVLRRRAASATQEETTEAPAVRCFLHYLDALRAADVAVPVPAGETQAVHVLTLHQSKGLEFQVVYLPGLAQGQFPAGLSAREEVCPPGFRESDAPGERDAEERSLFYVGATRARDVLVITRAASYARTAGNVNSKAQPSTLLALMDDAPDWSSAAAALSTADLERLAVTASAYGVADDNDDEEGEDGEEVALAPESGPEHDVSLLSEQTFRLHDLEQYLACPRQYKYARRYGLLDPAEDAVHRFHRYLRRGAQALRDLQDANPAAEWPAAEARLRALWATDGPSGHAYDAFYWQAAAAILRKEWGAITALEGAGASDQTLLAQSLHARLRRCVVEITADRVIHNSVSSGDPEAPAVTTLVRLHTGRPREDDKNDLALPLYYLAHQQQHPGVPVRIMLAYAGAALTGEAVEPTSELGRDDLVDVTESARRDAEKYLKPDRKQRSKLDKLDEAALRIVAEQFAPRPEEQRCAACAYCYVCPADPDGAELSLPRQPVVAEPPVQTGA